MPQNGCIGDIYLTERVIWSLKQSLQIPGQISASMGTKIGGLSWSRMRSLGSLTFWCNVNAPAHRWKEDLGLSIIGKRNIGRLRKYYKASIKTNDTMKSLVFIINFWGKWRCITLLPVQEFCCCFNGTFLQKSSRSRRTKSICLQRIPIIRFHHLIIYPKNTLHYVHAFQMAETHKNSMHFQLLIVKEVKIKIIKYKKFNV